MAHVISLGAGFGGAEVAYEKYFLRKMRKDQADPIYEKYIMKAFGIERLKPDETHADV
ncbi:MAG: hypothetical protein ABI304_00065 [Rudaea sp.]